MNAQLLSLMTDHLLQIAGGLLLVFFYYREKIPRLYKNKLVFLTGAFLTFFGLFRIILLFTEK